VWCRNNFQPLFLLTEIIYEPKVYCDSEIYYTLFERIVIYSASIIMQVPLIRLQCGVNSYDWGKVGKESAAAKFGTATPRDDFSIQDDKPYAEVCSYKLI
jgi:hypothetical protein